MAVAPNYYEYPTSYNGTNVSSVSDFFLDYPAYISGDIAQTVLPIFIFLSIMVVLLPFGVGAAVAAASFISFILTSFLWWNGFLDIAYPMVFLMMSIVSAILIGNKKGL